MATPTTGCVGRNGQGCQDCTSDQAIPADKRIPVTEETRKELHALKDPGETYDDLLKSLAQQRRRKELADRFREMDESREEFVGLNDG